MTGDDGITWTAARKRVREGRPRFGFAGLDRDLTLLLFANVAFALGFGLYAQLFYVYSSPQSPKR